MKWLEETVSPNFRSDAVTEVSVKQPFAGSPRPPIKIEIRESNHASKGSGPCRNIVQTASSPPPIMLVIGASRPGTPPTAWMAGLVRPFHHSHADRSVCSYSICANGQAAQEPDLSVLDIEKSG